MLKHYIEFCYPGLIVSETSEILVESRNLLRNMPDGAIAYRFFDIEEVNLDGETLKGKKKNYSNWHYKGKRMSLEEVKRNFPDKKILISNMESNKYPAVVSINGHFYPLEDGDIVMEGYQ